MQADRHLQGQPDRPRGRRHARPGHDRPGEPGPGAGGRGRVAPFGFRSADITFIRRFPHDFPGAGQLRLEENFRSTGHILSAANAVIARDPKRLGKTLRTSKGPGEPVEVVAFHDAEDEAVGLVAEMKRRHAQEGVPWEAMALLYRSTFLSRGFEEALMRARVPYVLVGDVGFYQRTEIKDALALLGVVSPNSRKFRQAKSSPATIASRSMICPLPRKV